MWFFINGYVTIMIRGLTLERFIGKLCAQNIRLVDTRRISRTKIVMKVSRQDYKKIKKLLESGMYDCRVMRSTGLFYIVMRLMERPLLCAGALICLLLIFNIQNYVASISFIGDANNEVCKEIEQELYESGVKKGANIKNLDLVAVRNQCLKNIPEVIFIGINRVGMDIIVEAIQRPYVPQMQYRGVPCNIISSKDCIIHDMSVLSGHPVVNVGDTVKKGQLLVSGIIPTRNGEGEPLYARSIANIDARVFYSATEKALKYTPISERTGKKKRGFELKFGQYGIINFDVKDFAHSEIETRQINLLPGILPFYVIIDEYHELKVRALPKDIDTAYNEAKLKAQAKATSKVPGYAEIVDIKVYYNEYESHVNASAYIECIEPVAVQIPLN